MAHFLSEERASVGIEMQDVIEGNVDLAREKSSPIETSAEAADFPFALRRLTPDDAHALTGLYGMVFESYPFPIFV